METRDIAPCASTAVGFARIAIVAGAVATADFFIRFEHPGRHSAALDIRRLHDDGEQVFGAHHAAHTTSSREAGFTVAALQLVDRAAGNRRVGILLPMFASRTDRGHMCIVVLVRQGHDFVVGRLPL